MKDISVLKGNSIQLHVKVDRLLDDTKKVLQLVNIGTHATSEVTDINEVTDFDFPLSTDYDLNKFDKYLSDETYFNNMVRALMHFNNELIYN